MRFANEFDDNAVNSNRNKQATLLTVAEPYIGWSWAAPRAEWTFDYHPSFSSGYPVSIYDSRSQLLASNLRLTPSKRLQIRMHENLLRTKNAFDQLQASNSASESSELDRPNNSIFSAAQESSDQTEADLSYALTRRAFVGASAAFYRVSYSSVIESRPIGSATSVGAHAFASYQFTRHHWIGFDYNVEDLVSDRPQSRALVQSFLYTDTLRLSRGMSLSFFAGPQHLLDRDELIPSFTPGTSQASETNWAWAAGANYAWSNARTTLSVGISRRISDGAGLQGIVELTSFNTQIRRRLTRRWDAEFSLSHDRNIATIAGLAPLSYASFAGGFSRSVNQKLSIECQYWRVHEAGFVVPLLDSLANHNRVSLSVLYNLKVPLQR